MPKPLLLALVAVLLFGCAKTSADIKRARTPVEYVVATPIETAFDNSYRALRGCVGSANASGSFYSSSRTADIEYVLNLNGSSNTILFIEMRPAPNDQTTLAVYGNSSQKPGEKTLFERWALGGTECK